MAQLPLAFLLDPLSIPLDQILPSRKALSRILTTRKFMRVTAGMVIFKTHFFEGDRKSVV